MLHCNTKSPQVSTNIKCMQFTLIYLLMGIDQTLELNLFISSNKQRGKTSPKQLLPKKSNFYFKTFFIVLRIPLRQFFFQSF